MHATLCYEGVQTWIQMSLCFPQSISLHQEDLGAFIGYGQSSILLLSYEQYQLGGK